MPIQEALNPFDVSPSPEGDRSEQSTTPGEPEVVSQPEVPVAQAASPYSRTHWHRITQQAVPFRSSAEDEATFIGHVEGKRYEDAVNMLPMEQKFARIDTARSIAQFCALRPRTEPSASTKPEERIWVCRVLVKIERDDGKITGVGLVKKPCFASQLWGRWRQSPLASNTLGNPYKEGCWRSDNNQGR